MAKKAKTMVLVTTAHRGVFAGRLVSREETAEGYCTVRLEGARCAIRWGTTGGFLELASKGPTGGRSKIGAVAPGAIELRRVTSITECTDEAAAAWERA